MQTEVGEVGFAVICIFTVEEADVQSQVKLTARVCTKEACHRCQFLSTKPVLLKLWSQAPPDLLQNAHSQAHLDLLNFGVGLSSQV